MTAHYLKGLHWDDLRDLLSKGVFVVDGEGTIDLEDEDPVSIGVVFDVQGYGPHPAAIYVNQNRYEHEDAALQGAYEILEEWNLTNHGDYLRELEEEYGDDAYEVFTETFDGTVITLPAEEAVKAITNSSAKKFVDIL